MSSEQPVPETPAQKNARRNGQCMGVFAGNIACGCEAYERWRTIDGYARCICQHTQGIHRVVGEAHGN